MNAYQELQTSGNQWPPTLYQGFEESPVLAEPQQPSIISQDLKKPMSAFAGEHEPVLKQLRKHFVMPADSSVVTFLAEHRTLPQILLEAAPQLRACFGTETLFKLKAPIDASGSRTLYAVAMWPGDVRDVRDALGKFDDAWWIAHSRLASGYLTFTYELV